MCMCTIKSNSYYIALTICVNKQKHLPLSLANNNELAIQCIYKSEKNTIRKRELLYHNIITYIFNVMSFLINTALI